MAQIHGLGVLPFFRANSLSRDTGVAGLRHSCESLAAPLTDSAWKCGERGHVDGSIIPGVLCLGLVAGRSMHICKQKLSRTSQRKSRSSRGSLHSMITRSARGGATWPSDYVSGSTAEDVVKNVRWPDSWPYTRGDFSRQDESDDINFYSQPRLCTHVADSFIESLRKYYATVFARYPQGRLLDICSSWISHYPENKTWSHVSITGMNEYELRMNKQADDHVAQNLNVSPTLPYPSESFDVVTCTVSFDYLNKPLEVMKEVARVLKPGGSVILSTSNRCFQSKAVNIWLRTDDLQHVLIYASYMHYTGCFEAPEAFDLAGGSGGSDLERMLKPWLPGASDPVFVIQARKKP